MTNPLYQRMEHRGGIEPALSGFADRRLSIWLATQ